MKIACCLFFLLKNLLKAKFAIDLQNQSLTQTGQLQRPCGGSSSGGSRHLK